MKFIMNRKGRSVELYELNSSILVYRIPYQDLKGDQEALFPIKNPFIVYILFGENEEGKNVLYVGKSKNGVKNRPTSHEDLYYKWDYCYILTQLEEKTFFNDGTIQYLEHKIKKRVEETNHYVCKTRETNSGTANRNDEEDCEIYLDKAYQMLDALGLDLITFFEQDVEPNESVNDQMEGCSLPDGIYYLSRKLKRWGNRTAKGKMQASNGKLILLKGSDVCPNEGPGLQDSIRIRRETASISDHVLQEDIIFDYPSPAAEFIFGSSTNGWAYWKTESGEAIDRFRNGGN